MRRPWVLLIALTCAGHGVAMADGRQEPRRGFGANVDFWREVIDPNADEVADILGKARELMQRPDHPLNGDTDWAVEPRAKFYRDARNLLSYARKLSPQNVEVLSLLGRAHDELGDVKEALAVLETCVKVTGPDKVPIDVAGRLGAIHVRLGDHDTALKWLRVAQGPLSTVSAPSLINLANLLAARGDTARAIDVLVNAIPSGMLGNYSHDITAATFALAVLYDRDEQHAAAFTVIDQMQAALTQQYSIYVQNELVKLRLPNPEDIHYYRALLYESLGQYVEARAEWAHYVAFGATPWRARARAHIVAIDAQRRANPGAPPQAPSLTTTPPRRRYP